MISWIRAGPFLYDDLYRVGIAESVARYQRILDMFFITIVFEVGHSGDSALCVFGVGLVDAGLCNDEDPLVRKTLGHFQSIAQPCDPGAYNQEICLFHIREIGDEPKVRRMGKVRAVSSLSPMTNIFYLEQ